MRITSNHGYSIWLYKNKLLSNEKRKG